MDIFEVRCFIAAATLGSFSAAAIENNISQSSFSKRIMALENELGVMLFSRKNRGIRLTLAGECFLDHAYALLSDYNKMLSEMGKFTFLGAEVIKIAAIHILSPYHLVDVIAEFRTLHTGIGFHLVEDESEMVLSKLKKQECDFALLRADYLDPALFHIRPLVTDRLVAVLSERHPLAGKHRISLNDLQDEQFALPIVQSDLYKICADACHRAGFVPNVVYNISGKLDIMLCLVRKNDAVTIFMERVISHYDLTGCKIIPLKEEVVSSTALVWLKSARLSPACRLFEHFLTAKLMPTAR